MLTPLGSMDIMLLEVYRQSHEGKDKVVDEKNKGQVENIKSSTHNMCP